MSEVDEYINKYDGEVKARLIRLRELITTEAPNAVEGFSYGLVGYKLHGKPLVYFGGFKATLDFTRHLMGTMLSEKSFQNTFRGRVLCNCH